MEPAGVVVPALVRLQARRSIDALAIVDGDRSMTYGDLEAKSNDLSSYLKSFNLSRDTVIGLCMERSAAQIVAALAIMKAGAAYLPLDPRDPAERLQFALRDARVGLVMIADDESAKPASIDQPVISVHGDGSTTYASPLVHDAALPLSDDLAYVIYTSGSTGQPKGVEITHAALANLCDWHTSAFNLSRTDRATYISAVGFDAAVWELWPSLTAGASIFIADDSVAREPQALADWLVEKGITITFVSTPLAERLLEFDYPLRTALRVMLTGADVLHRYPPPSLPFQFYNNYGPTEATVVATSVRIDPTPDTEGRPPSIGRAIANTDIYILDEDGEPQEDEVEGEIGIAGVGLARGYRGRPDLTSEKFIWISHDGETPVRVYRTGDRGQRRSDGLLAFLGRVDDQIKLRGFRIELREIEVALNAHNDVLESAVIVSEIDGGERQIVAFLVARPGCTLSLERIQGYLTTRLPAHMTPSRFVELPKLPLTANGKVNRSALSTLELGESLNAEHYVAPTTGTEKRVASIVCSLLKLDQISVEGNFFTLGGHSLLGTQLISRLRDAFGITIKLRFLFESPTISALSAEIERRLLERLDTIEDRLSAADTILGSEMLRQSAGRDE